MLMKAESSYVTWHVMAFQTKPNMETLKTVNVNLKMHKMKHSLIEQNNINSKVYYELE